MLFPQPESASYSTLYGLQDQSALQTEQPPCPSPSPLCPPGERAPGRGRPRVHAGSRGVTHTPRGNTNRPWDGHPRGRKPAAMEQTAGWRHKEPFHLGRSDTDADLHLEVQNESKHRVSELALALTCLQGSNSGPCAPVQRGGRRGAHLKRRLAASPAGKPTWCPAAHPRV